jgi:methylmalonyl-CoA/ethylmalonyl-CoA epimerase
VFFAICQSAQDVPKGEAMKIQSVDHISFAVIDIDKTIEAWGRLYGLGPWTFRENGGTDIKGRPWKIRMAFAYVGPVEIELVQCTEGRIFQSKFLEKWGEGLHHIGFFVDDVDAEVANLVKEGANVLIHDPGRFAYVDAGGPGGAIFELMSKRE